IYGPPFSGKTTLAGTLAKNFKLYWFDLESGINVLLNSVSAEHQQNVNVFQIPDSASWPIAIETMIKALRGPEVHICQLHGKVACARCIKSGDPVQPFHFAGLTSSDCVVIDSGTQLTASAMSSVTKNQDDLYKLQL